MVNERPSATEARRWEVILSVAHRVSFAGRRECDHDALHKDAAQHDLPTCPAVTLVREPQRPRCGATA